MATNRARQHLAAMKRLGKTESVTYRPAKGGLPAREIDALVSRTMAPMMHGQAMQTKVTVLNDAADGIPSNPTLSDQGADRIDVADRFGGTAVARGIQQFVDVSGDWLTAIVQ